MDSEREPKPKFELKREMPDPIFTAALTRTGSSGTAYTGLLKKQVCKCLGKGDRVWPEPVNLPEPAQHSGVLVLPFAVTPRPAPAPLRTGCMAGLHTDTPFYPLPSFPPAVRSNRLGGAHSAHGFLCRPSRSPCFTPHFRSSERRGWYWFYSTRLHGSGSKSTVSRCHAEAGQHPQHVPALRDTARRVAARQVWCKSLLSCSNWSPETELSASPVTQVVRITSAKEFL